MGYATPAIKRARQKAWEDKNKAHVRAKQRAWYAKHREKERERYKLRAPAYREIKNKKSKERYAARRDEILGYHKKYREQNLEVVRARRRAWVKANRDQATAATAKWFAAKFNACPSWVDDDALKAIYREAARLTREIGIQHDVDHIVPLQSDVVCGLHVPWNMQILTHAENARKSNRVD